MELQEKRLPDGPLPMAKSWQASPARLLHSDWLWAGVFACAPSSGVYFLRLCQVQV